MRKGIDPLINNGQARNIHKKQGDKLMVILTKIWPSAVLNLWYFCLAALFIDVN